MNTSPWARRCNVSIVIEISISYCIVGFHSDPLYKSGRTRGDLRCRGDRDTIKSSMGAGSTLTSELWCVAPIIRVKVVASIPTQMSSSLCGASLQLHVDFDCIVDGHSRQLKIHQRDNLVRSRPLRCRMSSLRHSERDIQLRPTTISVPGCLQLSADDRYFLPPSDSKETSESHPQPEVRVPFLALTC